VKTTNIAALIRKQETDIWNVYPYGSQVYGTANENSDHDYIVVLGQLPNDTNDMVFGDKINIILHDVSTFRQSLDDHSPSALECWFLPDEMKLKEIFRPKDFKINLAKLRASFSAKASNSLVKAKKKFEIANEIYIGKKSLFHSLRILKFGTMIATNGKIDDFGCINNFWEDIYTNPSINWEDYKAKWQPIYNQIATEFRLAAPKKG